MRKSCKRFVRLRAGTSGGIYEHDNEETSPIKMRRISLTEKLRASLSRRTMLPRFSDGMCETGSVVGIATAYGLDGLGIESRWGRDFPHLSRPALRHT